MHALLAALLFSTARADAAVALVMRTQRVAAVSIGMMHGGRPVYERGYGFADLGRRIRSTPATVYRIGSLSKSFTAVAVLRLAARGKVRLDDRVDRYVHPFPFPAGVTIEQLLTHRSGIPSYSDDASLDRTRTYTPAELVAAAARSEQAIAPGTTFWYSNTNYVLLGMVIERATGMSYGAYLARAVIAPLALANTRYGDTATQAHGYARDTLASPVRPSSVAFAYAAAGLSSNVPDLLKWLPEVPAPYYGFFQANIYGQTIEYATGSVNGYSCAALFSPQTRDAVVVLTNADELDVLPLVKSLFELLTNRSGAPGAQNPQQQRGSPRARNPARAPAAT